MIFLFFVGPCRLSFSSSGREPITGTGSYRYRVVVVRFARHPFVSSHDTCLLTPSSQNAHVWHQIVKSSDRRFTSFIQPSSRALNGTTRKPAPRKHRHRLFTSARKIVPSVRVSLAPHAVRTKMSSFHMAQPPEIKKRNTTADSDMLQSRRLRSSHQSGENPDSTRQPNSTTQEKPGAPQSSTPPAVRKAKHLLFREGMLDRGNVAAGVDRLPCTSITQILPSSPPVQEPANGGVHQNKRACVVISLPAREPSLTAC